MPDIYGPNSSPASDNSMQFKPGSQFFNSVGGFDFTIGAEAGNVITVSIQVKDVRDRALNRRAIIGVTLASASFGEPDASFDAVAVTVGTVIAEDTAGFVFWVQTNATGLVTMTFQTTATVDYFIRAFCGDVMVQASSVLDFS